MAHVSPASIFSPSVARQNLAISKDWEHIDAWLAATYAPQPVPPIERNADTLKYLLHLSALNHSADEQIHLHHRSTLAALAAAAAAQPPRDDPLLTDLQQGLTRDGATALEALASLSQHLHVPDGDARRLARAIVALQREACDAEQSARRVAVLHRHVAAESQALDRAIAELEGPHCRVSADRIAQTQEYARKAKALGATLPGMRERVRAAEHVAGVGGGAAADGRDRAPTIQEVAAEERSFRALRRETTAREAELAAFRGLPHDTDLARLEVEAVKEELRELRRRRDALFEGLVERETPRKGR